MYVANVDERASPTIRTRRVRERAPRKGAVVVPVCAAIEAEIAQLEEAERAEFLRIWARRAGPESRDPRRLRSCSGCRPTSPPGPKEVRAWTVRAGSTAPQAAGVIHTDFERGFIRAEVIAFEDYIAYKGEAGAKEAGKLRLEGKEYIVREGDVMHFRFNV
jgi:ribosome-binding ATPase